MTFSPILVKLAVATALFVVFLASGAARNGVSAAAMCGSTATPPARYDHVIWIIEEDKNYGTVVGSQYAPYINSTLIPSCGLATNFHPETHNSLGDYIAMSSGSLTKQTPPSIFAQLKNSGRTWRAYMESMPRNCYGANAGHYTHVHNPPVWFNDASGECPAWDVPYSKFSTDLNNGNLPTLSIIAADNSHNMHDNPVSSAVANGDAWLKAELSKIVASSTYRAGRTAIFVTWDEGNGPKSSTLNYQGENCLAPANAYKDVSCHVATLVIAPSVPSGSKSSTFFSHYSMLRATEEMLGLGLLGNAAKVTSMRPAFRL